MTDAQVLVIHGPTSGSVATRLAMDLRSDGIEARAVLLSLLAAEAWQAGLPGVAGVVIVYDGRTWIDPPVYEALCSMHPARPVVFVRSRTSRFAPDFEKFSPVVLFDESTFSHYQPTRDGLSGYALVTELLGVPKPRTDRRRRGFAFISYAGSDKQAVCDRLVPAIAGNDVGFFDYRFSDRLDESRLPEEIERSINSCALVVVYASVRWAGSPYTLLERDLALSARRPVVAVYPSTDAAQLPFPHISCAFEAAPDGDCEHLRRAIEQATGPWPFADRAER